MPMPTGETMPSPVTTTLRLVIRHSGCEVRAAEAADAAPRAGTVPGDYCLTWAFT